MVHAGNPDIEMVTIPRNVYETLLETLEVLSDKAEIESIKRGIEDIRAGRIISEREFLKRHKGLLTK
jgi:PHD/YefM family antitoxin component YafN of YafNO toxin-antitoxin module